MKHRLLFSLIIISAALILTSARGRRQAAAPSLALEWQSVAPGAQYAKFEGELFGCAQTFSVFRYSPRRMTTDIVSDPGLYPSRAADCPIAVDTLRPATTTSGFGERYEALAALNGSYFNTSTLYPTTFVRDECETEGTTLCSETFRVDGCVATDGRRLRIFAADSASCHSVSPQCKDALASGPLLISDGRPRTSWPESSFFTGRHPRTVIGIGSDRRIYLIVIDGRNGTHASGTTIAETTELCRLLGLRDALNLDGGGSSTLWLCGKGVVSHPSDNGRWDNAGERVVPNAVVVR